MHSTTTGTTLNSKRHHWIVRPSNENDKESLELLLRTSYENLLAKDYDAHLLKTALPRICSVRPELLTSSTWYVVEHPETGELVGCGGWTPKSPFQEDTPHLRHFATHPTYTRQGIARALWDRTWSDWCEYYYHHNSTKNKQDTPAAEERRPDMEVFSTLTAESFYASLGFQKVQDIVIPLAEDCAFPSILMRRPDTP